MGNRQGTEQSRGRHSSSKREADKDCLLSTSLYHFTEFLYFATLACIILEHFFNFPFVIAGNTIRQHMNGVTFFSHIVASGFYIAGAFPLVFVKMFPDTICISATNSSP